MRRAFPLLLLFCVATPILLASTSRTTTPPGKTHLTNTYPSGPRTTPPAQSTEVLVAAAADLKFAMDSVVAVFSRQNPTITVKVVYGSSGNFFQQISNSAPFDLFFSADIDYPAQLQQQHKTLSDVKTYGTGQLVLWSKTLDPNPEKMNTLLNSAIKKIAIANPAHAPYGKRAEESLRYYQLYDKIKDKLVIGENIAQTAQYAQSGAADIGIIALSLALSPTMQQAGGKYWLIPAGSHQPLQQGYVLLSHAKGNAGAEKFAGFFSSPAAAAVLKNFGFGQP
jgi:molybdate transport system substrate-binding protein